MLLFINDVTGIGAVSIEGFSVQESNGLNKTIRLDTSVRLSTGEIVNVEMQQSSQDRYLDRAVYYAARLYSEQATDKSYNGLNKVISIHILNFNHKELKGRLLSRFRLINEESDITIDRLDLYFVSLKAKVDNNEKVVDWKNFFNLYKKEELFVNTRIQQVHDKLKSLSLTLEERYKYEEELKKLMDEEASKRDREKALKEKERVMEENTKLKEELFNKDQELFESKLELVQVYVGMGLSLKDSLIKAKVKDRNLAEKIIKEINK